MKEEISSTDTFSILIGFVSIILTVLFIEDKAIKISIGLATVLVIISIFLILIFKDINSNSQEIKKMNEKLDIYQRLNKLETLFALKGDKK